LQILKKERNKNEVNRALKDLERAVSENRNIMPYILSAVKSYCTVGEIVEVLERRFGRYRP
jgi:methylmalonyl-CoA mutase N-terminal domain/subunit